MWLWDCRIEWRCQWICKRSGEVSGGLVVVADAEVRWEGDGKRKQAGSGQEADGALWEELRMHGLELLVWVLGSRVNCTVRLANCGMMKSDAVSCK